MKFVKWKNFIFTVILVLLSMFFFKFILNKIIKSAIISIGESIFSAKVDIKDVKASILNLSIKIKGIQVADKNNPWTNLFEVRYIGFALKPLPLLEKKIIIDEMALEGLAFSTRRKTIGTLPAKKIKKIEKKKVKTDENSIFSKIQKFVVQKAENELSKTAVYKDVKDLQKEISNIDINNIIDQQKDNFQSIKLIENISIQTKTSYEKYKNDLSDLNIENNIKKANELLDEIRNLDLKNLQNIQLAKQKINSLEDTKNYLNQSLKNIELLRKNITSEISQTYEAIKKISDAVNNDYLYILSIVKLPIFSQEGIAGQIVGKMFYSKVARIIEYLMIARHYLKSSKKSENKIVLQRLKGRDIIFYKKNSLPSFWIKKISISGTFANNLNISGLAKNISSDQRLVGMVSEVRITGNKDQSNYNLYCIFDRIKEVSEDKIELSIRNISIDSFLIDQINYFPKISSANLSILMNTNLISDMFDCKMEIALNNINYEKKSEDSISNILFEVISSLNNINFIARIYGKIDNLRTEFDSNIDEILQKRIKDLYSKTLDNFKKDVKNKIEAQISQRKEELLSNIKTIQKDYTVQIENNVAELKKHIEMIEKEKEKLKKQIEEKAQTEVEKKLEDLKKDGLKNIFGK